MYLYDIIVFSSTVQAHTANITGVFDLLKKARLPFKLKAFFFLQSSVDYLWHFIRPEKRTVGAKNCDGIQGIWQPPNQTVRKYCLGLWNVFRRFVPNFVQI